MRNEILDEQKAYYRARAAEYDETAYPRRERDERRVEDVISTLDVHGDVLELACGTGMWTRALARHADSVTAVDQSAEVIQIARGRCPSTVRFVVSDMTVFEPDRTWNVVFFAFWLSHVRDDDLAAFFARVAGFVRPGGRILIVDEDAGSAPQGDLTGEIEVRRLRDGTAHRIVKVYRDAGELGALLAGLGWSATFDTNGQWLIAQAHQA